MDSDITVEDESIKITLQPELVNQSENQDETTIPSISDELKETLRDQMKDLFATIIKDIDRQVLTVSESQCELDSQLDKLISILDSIEIDKKLTGEISANAKRISSLKSRLTLIHTILNNSSDRCGRTLAACRAAVSSIDTPATQAKLDPVTSSSS